MVQANRDAYGSAYRSTMSQGRTRFVLRTEEEVDEKVRDRPHGRNTVRALVTAGYHDHVDHGEDGKIVPDFGQWGRWSVPQLRRLIKEILRLSVPAVPGPVTAAIELRRRKAVAGRKRSEPSSPEAYEGLASSPLMNKRPRFE